MPTQASKPSALSLCLSKIALMEDDEFGDLYTDVLQTFQPSSAPHPPPVQSNQLSPDRSIDLNVQSDDDEILVGAPNSNPKSSFTSYQPSQTPDSNSHKTAQQVGLDGSSDSRWTLNLGGKQKDEGAQKEDVLAEGTTYWASDLPEPSVSRVLEGGGDGELQAKVFEDPNLIAVGEMRDDKNAILAESVENLMDKKENFEKFDIEDDDTGIGSEPVIPGLSIPGVSNAVDNQDGVRSVNRMEGSDEDDWDSDSEDDLQIVLNDNNHGPMVVDGTGAVGSDDEDEDGDPLVIVADNDPGHQPMEEQEWGDDAAQAAADGERKELGDAAKVNGAMAAAPKIGYSNHAYQPYHSQFKYVRPGAAPVPGVAPVGSAGAPGHVRPPVNMGPVAGRGRGDWRPTGMKNASLMQKSLHPGYGVPAWGNNSSGRGFGSGLDFTLPSHKTIFEVNIESFDEKPWRLPGIDMSDFFNFGLHEESWKDYCKQLEQLRLEGTMQSKIRVYESGRTEQEYDPDLPPELAAAAGIHDNSSENANLGKMDAGQYDVANGSARVRPQLPTGRAIQVEVGSGERLPSIDTRPPRVRDSDAIIEIVLQDSIDDNPRNDLTEQRENFRVGQDIKGDVSEEGSEHFDGSPRSYHSRNRELAGKKATFTNSIQNNCTEGDGILPFPAEAQVQCSAKSGDQTSAYPGRDVGTLHGERGTKGNARERSPKVTRSVSTLDKRSVDDQEEVSDESIGRKHRLRLSSPVVVGSAEEPDAEHGDDLRDELVLADESSGMERKEMAFGRTAANDTPMDENLSPSVKKQKLISRVEQSSLQEVDDGGDMKAARSSENSKARSGSSRDYHKMRDSVDEEVVQHGRRTLMRDLRRPFEDQQNGKRKNRDERHGSEKYRTMEKGREDSSSRRDWEPHSAHHSHMKIEGLDRRMEREYSEVARQRREDEPHGRRTRAEDTRKQERGDEIGSRHRHKLRESENMDKDEPFPLRKQLDNGYSRGHHDKDVGSRHRERDDSLKPQYENMVVNLRNKRRKEDESLRRDAEKEEFSHGHRENISHRKRQRDDVSELRKRDDQVRTKDDDHLSVKHKEEGWIYTERGEKQREGDERHRLKQSHEETLLKREREEGRSGVRSLRTAEDKPWVSHSRTKDEYRGSSDRDYQFKDSGGHSEQLKRRDRVEDGSLSQYRGREDVHPRVNQLSNDDRRSRLEKASSRNDHAIGGSDKNRVHERKHKENSRKVKHSEGVNQNSMRPSKSNQEVQSGQLNEPVILKGQGNSEHDNLVNRHSSRKHREDASSDDEQQTSRRGRSKLERWTSHKELDFSINMKSSSSLKAKEIDKYSNGRSSLANKLPDDPSNTVETIRDPENQNVEAKPVEDKHLDTVEKLKKRSERFKLPMPSEKDPVVVKKMESEPLPSAQSEARAGSDIKPERPTRKRRWISN